ncbi:MAG TPA: hypothetical protein VIB48_15675 [Acidimicrobiia bacterium]
MVATVVVVVGVDVRVVDVVLRGWLAALADERVVVVDPALLPLPPPPPLVSA